MFQIQNPKENTKKEQSKHGPLGKLEVETGSMLFEIYS